MVLAEIHLPKQAPERFKDRETLWNVDVNGNALEEWKAFPQEKKAQRKFVAVSYTHLLYNSYNGAFSTMLIPIGKDCI